MKSISLIQKFLRDEEGVTAIEYGLIAALVAVVIIAGATLLGTNLNALFSAIAGKISGATPA
jgi:pilus assembly protein Flp/PilA